MRGVCNNGFNPEIWNLNDFALCLAIDDGEWCTRNFSRILRRNHVS